MCIPAFSNSANRLLLRLCHRQHSAALSGKEGLPMSCFSTEFPHTFRVRSTLCQPFLPPLSVRPIPMGIACRQQYISRQTETKLCFPNSSTSQWPVLPGHKRQQQLPSLSVLHEQHLFYSCQIPFCNIHYFSYILLVTIFSEFCSVLLCFTAVIVIPDCSQYHPPRPGRRESFFVFLTKPL